MSSPLLSSILGSLDPRTIGDLASRNGISEGALSKSVEPLAAALLTGAATKASSPGVATQLFSLVSGPASEDAGSKLISTVFGNNTSAAADTLGRATGLSSGAVGPALTLLAPALLAGVGKLVRDRGVSASAFSGLLSNEASAVKGVLPAGVSTLFGSTAPAPEVLRTVRETVSPVAVATVREDKKSLMALGVPTERLESRRYGEEHAIAPNTTEECRALNRRIAISVRAK